MTKNWVKDAAPFLKVGFQNRQADLKPDMERSQGSIATLEIICLRLHSKLIKNEICIVLDDCHERSNTASIVQTLPARIARRANEHAPYSETTRMT
eukprot:scaffold468953_cov39-Prasinocladus_malaysianus.AAC.1